MFRRPPRSPDNSPDHDIPEPARKLIATAIGSVMALELLLLLYRRPEREWSAEEAALELQTARGWTHTRLSEFSRQGLLSESGESHAYRYYPETMDLNAAVAALASAYEERPADVIAFIHSKPSRGFWSLLEGFRFPRI